jgi:hypothetical protein
MRLVLKNYHNQRVVDFLIFGLQSLKALGEDIKDSAHA